MKVIIDIPEDMFEWFKNGEIIDEYDKSALKQIFKNGIPLDSVRAKIADVETYERDGYWVMRDVWKVLNDIDEEGRE